MAVVRRIGTTESRGVGVIGVECRSMGFVWVVPSIRTIETTGGMKNRSPQISTRCRIVVNIVFLASIIISISIMIVFLHFVVIILIVLFVPVVGKGPVFLLLDEGHVVACAVGPPASAATSSKSSEAPFNFATGDDDDDDDDDDDGTTSIPLHNN